MPNGHSVSRTTIRTSDADAGADADSDPEADADPMVASFGRGLLLGRCSCPKGAPKRHS